MRVAVKDHFKESHRLQRALLRAGHTLVEDTSADVLLIDLDTPIFGYRDLIDAFAAAGAAIVLYPHGAGVMLGHDGLWEPYPPVDANLVFAPGFAELARRMEYPAPTHVMGWSYCDLLPFRPAADVRTVLFAPTHPSGDGSMADSYRAANAETYAKLLEGPWKLVVRHIGTLEQNGLWQADGVEYVTGWLDLSYKEIDEADCVVAADGTFPSLAVARGVPTVMYGQGHPPMFGLPGEQPITLRHGDRYLDYVRYPFDAADGPLDELIHAAARSEAPVLEWKRRFIGEPFDDAAFPPLLERIVADARAGGSAPIDDTRAFTVVALADELRERPELLAAYAERFRPEDDATLAIWGPGASDAALLGSVQATIAAAGVDEDRLPDILLLPLPGGAQVDRRLARRADALLSEWPGAGRLGELPRLGAAGVREARDVRAVAAAATA